MSWGLGPWLSWPRIWLYHTVTFIWPTHTKFPSHKKENTEKSLELGHWTDNTPRLRSWLNAVKPTFLLPDIAGGRKLLPTHPFTVYFPPHRYRPSQNNAKMLQNLRTSSWAGKEQVWGQAEQLKSLLGFTLMLEVAVERTRRVVPPCDATALRGTQVCLRSLCLQALAASNCSTDCFFHTSTWILNNRHL